MAIVEQDGYTMHACHPLSIWVKEHRKQGDQRMDTWTVWMVVDIESLRNDGYGNQTVPPGFVCEVGPCRGGTAERFHQSNSLDIDMCAYASC